MARAFFTLSRALAATTIGDAVSVTARSNICADLRFVSRSRVAPEDFARLRVQLPQSLWPPPYLLSLSDLTPLRDRLPVPSFNVHSMLRVPLVPISTPSRSIIPEIEPPCQPSPPQDIIAPSSLDNQAAVPLQAIKRTYQPSWRSRLRKHGFLNRLKDRHGRKIIRRRLAKGRKYLGVK
mmetsp:Transcript_23111/g.38020  ORF Transcript_23111/g.38020 Transcript_23111/m.38020 type:complete len:179 (+) Transcript_23111:43-579(+)